MIPYFVILLLCSVVLGRQTCTVGRSLDGGDDSNTIVQAFKTCGQGGKIIFEKGTYNVHRTMNTTGLKDTQIELRGKLLVRL